MHDIGELIEKLSDKNVAVQVKAFRTLIRLGPDADAAIPVLISKLDDASYAVADMAWVALTHIGKGALDALIEAAQSCSIQRRTLALAALGDKTEDIEKVLPVLISALTDDDKKIQSQAAKTIVGLKINCVQQGIPLTQKLTESVNTARKILESIRDELWVPVTLRELKKAETMGKKNNL